MCVIMSKPENVAFPEMNILKNCWDNNPDMGGFMYALDGKVHIHKGFMTWESFKEALDKARKKTGDKVPYVCHFRISTQGYDKACCQPFPLSGNMNNLKRLKSESNIGVAHNGILSLTSDGSKDYSDTMKFITDYLVNIVRSYDWYKDNRTVKLISNLIKGSRFAILDKKGIINLLGEGWIEEKGCCFSNSTYSYKRYVYTGSGSLWDDPKYVWDKQTRSWKYVYNKEDDDERWNDYWKNVRSKTPTSQQTKTEVGFHAEPIKEVTVTEDKDEGYTDPWGRYYDESTGTYNFKETICPCSMEDDDSYCSFCTNCNNCTYVFAVKKACGLN